jgi:hypothetical protein
MSYEPRADEEIRILHLHPHEDGKGEAVCRLSLKRPKSHSSAALRGAPDLQSAKRLRVLFLEEILEKRKEKEKRKNKKPL